MWAIAAALAGKVPVYGPVVEVELRAAPGPAPADALVRGGVAWLLDRHQIRTLGERADLLPLTDATLWLGPPGFPTVRRRGTPDPELVLVHRGREAIWDTRTGVLEPLPCGARISPYAFSADCRELRFAGVRLAPARYSRLVVSGGSLWVFGAGQVSGYREEQRFRPATEGPVVHLGHDADTVYTRDSRGLVALAGVDGTARWIAALEPDWLAPHGPWLAIRVGDALHVLDRADGAYRYSLDGVAEHTFAWSDTGDLHGFGGDRWLRLVFEDAVEPGPASREALPAGLIPPGTLEVSLDGMPDSAVALRVDGIQRGVAPGAFRVGPMDRVKGERAAGLDLEIVHRDGRTETLRALRPEPGGRREVTLRWAPLVVELSGCCVLEPEPRLVGSLVRISEQRGPARYQREAPFLGRPWTIQPVREP